MASGTPVIAFKAGGALDFIKPSKTGLFFPKADAKSLAACLKADFQPKDFDPAELNGYALGYGKSEFLKYMKFQ